MSQFPGFVVYEVPTWPIFFASIVLLALEILGAFALLFYKERFEKQALAEYMREDEEPATTITATGIHSPEWKFLYMQLVSYRCNICSNTFNTYFLVYQHINDPTSTLILSSHHCPPLHGMSAMDIQQNSRQEGATFLHDFVDTGEHPISEEWTKKVRRYTLEPMNVGVSLEQQN